MKKQKNTSPFEFVALERKNCNPKCLFINEWRGVADSNWFVNRFSLGNSTSLYYTVWCPTDRSRYSTTILHEGDDVGNLTTRLMSSYVEEAFTPGSKKHRMAVRAHYKALYTLAREYIKDTFPEDFTLYS